MAVQGTLPVVRLATETADVALMAQEGPGPEPRVESCRPATSPALHDALPHRPTSGRRLLFGASGAAAGDLDDEGVPALRAAVDMAVEGAGSASPEAAEARNRLGAACTGAGLLAEAVAAFGPALPVAEALVGTAPALLVALLHNIARLAEAQGRHADAEAVARRGIVLRRGHRMLAADPAGLAADMTALGTILAGSDRWDEAEALLREALTAWEALDDRYGEALTANGLALVLRRTDRSDEAERLLRRSLSGMIRLRGHHHPDTAVVRSNLAMLLVATDRRAAVGLLARAVADLVTELGPQHPLTTHVAGNLARVRSPDHGAEGTEPGGPSRDQVT